MLVRAEERAEAALRGAALRGRPGTVQAHGMAVATEAPRVGGRMTEIAGLAALAKALAYALEEGEVDAGGGFMRTETAGCCVGGDGSWR